MAHSQYSHQVPTRCVIYAWPFYNTVTRSPQGVLFMHGPLTIQSPGTHKVCCLCMALSQYSHQVPTRCVVYAWPSHNTVTRSPQGVLFMHGPLTIQSPGPHKVCCLCMALLQYSYQVPTRCVVYAWPSHNTVTRSPQGVLFMHGPLTIQLPGPHKVCCLCLALSVEVPVLGIARAKPFFNVICKMIWMMLLLMPPEENPMFKNAKQSPAPTQ